MSPVRSRQRGRRAALNSAAPKPTRFIANPSGEDGGVAVVRDLPPSDRANRRFVQVVEPELDMKRTRPQVSTLDRVIDLLRRWLSPMGREIVGSPRRSVGRELEEAWPSSEK